MYIILMFKNKKRESMLDNFKIKYDGLQTMWVYKDHTIPKDILNIKTIVLYKKGSMVDFCIGRWKYEPDTAEILVSWSPTLETKIVKVKNPKIRFYIDSHKLFYKKDKEKCFDLANKKIENIIKEFVADDKIQTSTKSTINNSESFKN